MLLSARPYFCLQFDSLFLTLYFFQESHSKDDITFWKSQWGSEIWFSHGSEHSAGVSCLKNNFAGDVLHRPMCDEYGHFVLLILKCYNVILIVVNYYGYNSNMRMISYYFVWKISLLIGSQNFQTATY